MFRDSKLTQQCVEASFFSFGSARGGKFCQTPEAFPNTATFKIRIPVDRFGAFVRRRSLIAVAIPSQSNRQFAAALKWLLYGTPDSALPVPASVVVDRAPELPARKSVTALSFTAQPSRFAQS